MHRGTVGQPSPELVSRTAPPVTTMPVLASTVVSASRRTVSAEAGSVQREKSRGTR
jgi:hypothetical protein